MESLKLYNSLSGNVEEFHPVNKPFLIGLYTCGPTVYSFTHIGHLRTYVFEDVLKKLLIQNGFLVEHVMNTTDVGQLTSDSDTGEDKMEKQAKKENKNIYQIASFYTKDFLWNLKKVNIARPNILAPASHYIKEQIDVIKNLERKGYTYKTSDGIYFDTSKMSDYKTLFNQNKENLQSDERIENALEKRNPTDFALWKFSHKDEKRQMEWKSPWGIGFPGWHTECVAMSMKYLGSYFDIHCGGVDHIPVHHPNEIAQAKAITGNYLAKYWMHFGFLLKNSEKMSKSTGNFARIKDLIENNLNPLAYRLFVLNTYYRKTADFSIESVTASNNALNNLYAFAEKIQALKWLKLTRRIKFTNLKQGNITLQKFHTDFINALNDDLNTPKAMELVWNMLNEINKNLYSFNPVSVLKLLKQIDLILSLDILKHKVARIPLKIRLLAKKRFLLKKQKKFELSDKIRDQITSLGFKINDYQTFYTISKL